MTKQDVINFRKQKAQKYKQERIEAIKEDGRIGNFSNDEFNKSMKMSGSFRKSSTTRRSHSRGNLWNHHNLPKPETMKPWWKQ